MSVDSRATPELPLPNVPIIHRPGTPESSGLERPPLPVRKRLLIVDDEPAVLELVVRILRTDNYEIRSAESGPRALQLLEQPGASGVDLLVTDLMMPGMTGRELAAAVRSRTASVRVLYVTGFADTLFQGLQELGPGESFIEKPFGAAGLLEATRLLMFGHIADPDPAPDERDQPEPEWDVASHSWRARVVRWLRRWKIG